MPNLHQPGLVVRQKSPLNLEFQFAFLSDWLTPCDQFFVRSHFSAPELNETTKQSGGSASKEPFRHLFS
jgi:hypothetical protein